MQQTNAEWQQDYKKNIGNATDTLREKLKSKKRIVVKIGSSSLQHPETGDLDYTKMDILVRELCNIKIGRASWRERVWLKV